MDRVGPCQLIPQTLIDDVCFIANSE